jgi:hypothetical protein
VTTTPAARERYVDFLRAASIVVVMLGHWLMAVVTLNGTKLDVGNLIADTGGLWAATWVLQVMPVFFFVGGFVNLRSIDSLNRRGARYAEFAESRVRRLLRPVWLLLGVWLPLIALVQAFALVDSGDLSHGAVIVTQLLWFIGVYLFVIALAPPMLQLHRRYGAMVPIALAVGCAVVDLLRFTYGVPQVGFLNFALVWLFVHQLGFFYADGRVLRMPRALLWVGAVLGIAALWALTHLGPYPLSMVGLPGAPISNMNPPNLCLMALTVWQVSLVMLAREPVTRWLQRERPWAVVVGINAVIMTMLLWHLTALLLAVVVLYPLGFPQPVVGSWGWWLLRPVWIAILAAITYALVAAFGRFERAPALARPSARPSARVAASTLAALGIGLVIVGTLGFSVAGPVDFLWPNGRRLIVLPISPLISLVSLLAGVALLRGTSPQRPDPS